MKTIGMVDPLADYRAPDPGRPVPHPLPEGTTGILRMLEVARSDDQRALISLCGLVGCRISEALAVGPMDFELQDMVLSIRGKGDKTRIVPVSTRAWAVMEPAVIRAFAECRPTVISYQDRGARKVITDLGAKAGLRRAVSSHDLRATFATEVYNNCRDVRAVQELLGHSTVQTTEIYIGVTMDSMRKAAEL